jgi:hypothetical protein
MLHPQRAAQAQRHYRQPLRPGSRPLPRSRALRKESSNRPIFEIQPELEDLQNKPNLEAQPELEDLQNKPNLEAQPELEELQNKPNLKPQPEREELQNKPNLKPQPEREDLPNEPNFETQPEQNKTTCTFSKTNPFPPENLAPAPAPPDSVPVLKLDLAGASGPLEGPQVDWRHPGGRAPPAD